MNLAINPPGPHLHYCTDGEDALIREGFVPATLTDPYREHIRKSHLGEPLR